MKPLNHTFENCKLFQDLLNHHREIATRTWPKMNTFMRFSRGLHTYLQFGRYCAVWVRAANCPQTIAGIKWWEQFWKTANDAQKLIPVQQLKSVCGEKQTMKGMCNEAGALIPCMEQLIRLLLLCPAVSGSTARSFSLIRHLKTWLTTLSQHR